MFNVFSKNKSKNSQPLNLLFCFYYLKESNKLITIAKKATPSTNAAATIMFERMSPIASGCLAIASIAFPPICPMPIPAPITATPAPKPAPKCANPALASSKIYNNSIFIYV